MGAGRTFHLEIVTPDKQFFVGEADALILPALDGSLGVEAGHEPIATAVIPGDLRVLQNGTYLDLCGSGPGAHRGYARPGNGAGVRRGAP